jgi:hypothetical protein
LRWCAASSLAPSSSFIARSEDPPSTQAKEYLAKARYMAPCPASPPGKASCTCSSDASATSPSSLLASSWSPFAACSAPDMRAFRILRLNLESLVRTSLRIHVIEWKERLGMQGEIDLWSRGL